MKGIVFKLLEEVVSQQYSETTWDELLDRANVSGAYTSLGSYPDEELQRLVGATSEVLKLSPGATLRWFGHHAIALLAEQYPEFFSPHSNTISFLLTLNDIIHAEVRKLYPGADVPYFEFDTLSDKELVLYYASRRRLCALAEGFIQGVSVLYHERVNIDQIECMKLGASRCILHCLFSPMD